MSRLKSLTVPALAAAGLLVVGCSSSSSSSSSTTAASSPAASAITAATSPAATLPAASSPAAAAKPSAADCEIIKPIAASAVAKLTPLQSEPKSKATAGMKTYITSLAAAEAKLTSAGGKEVIGGFITALEKSGTESTSEATATVVAALGPLGSACP